MNMAKTPCCEKMGLKKGPWTAEEDQILISFIHRYGHGNWRALPKQAGLLRCGKSCRLRWINYLRPDIKRGKFSKEEEETILKLHEILGNRWSAIAARLPGRTDNEIKNFWHTHLKKRIEKLGGGVMHNKGSTSSSYSYSEALITMPRVSVVAPSSSSGGDASSFNGNKDVISNYDYNAATIVGTGLHTALVSSSDTSSSGETVGNNNGSNQISEEMKFWYNVFIKSGQIS